MSVEEGYPSCRLRLTRLDAGAVPNFARRFDIRGIPKIIPFSGGREVACRSGRMSRDAIAAFVERALYVAS